MVDVCSSWSRSSLSAALVGQLLVATALAVPACTSATGDANGASTGTADDAGSSADGAAMNPGSPGSTTPGTAPACGAHSVTAPLGTYPAFARVEPNGQRVAFSITRTDPVTQLIHYEIWEEGICGGGTTQLVANAGSRGFAFDAQGRIVYFAAGGALGHLQLVVRADDGTARPFLGGCDINYSSATDAIFVDVSPDGKRALISDLRGLENLHSIVEGGPACGVLWTSAPAGADGPVDRASLSVSVPSRLSPTGTLAFRAPDPTRDICSLPTDPPRPVDHSNDFRVYAFATTTNRLVTAPECRSPRSAALTPNGGILARYGSELRYWGPNGQPAASALPMSRFDNEVGKWFMDVSRDGAWYTENDLVAPFPFP